jgi:hypothetical protein
MDHTTHNAHQSPIPAPGGLEAALGIDPTLIDGALFKPVTPTLLGDIALASRRGHPIK